MCIPFDFNPMILSPFFIFDPSIRLSFSTTPTMNPARSYSSSLYKPGSSAVSPPIKEHPFSLHAIAKPFTICSAVSGISLDVPK